MEFNLTLYVKVVWKETDIKNTPGTLFYSTGATPKKSPGEKPSAMYSGDWEDNKRHGFGVRIW